MTDNIENVQPPKILRGTSSQTTTVTERGSSGSGSSGLPQDPSVPSVSSFTLDFCNIRGLSKNLAAVEAHLLTSSPTILALTETQISSNSDPSSFAVTNYSLYHNFRFKGGVCVYVHKDLPASRVSNLESPNFDVLWLKVPVPPSVKYICCLYRSPNASNYTQLFHYLTLKMEHILSLSPHAEVLLCGDFNAHHPTWLSSSLKDAAGEEAFNFSIENGLTQLVGEPTRVPDRPGDSPTAPDLCFVSHDFYSCISSPPLGSSDHRLISVSCPMAYFPSVTPTVKRKYWQYRSADWPNLQEFFFSFPWKDVCFSSRDPSICAEQVTEVILAGMEAFIPYSLSISNSKPWFNTACAKALSKKKKAFKHWCLFPSAASHRLYITARNHSNSVLRSCKSNFIKRKCSLLSSSNSGRPFWTLVKSLRHNLSSSSFPPLFRSDGSVATSPAEKANLFAEIFSSTSVLNDSGISPPVLPVSSPPMPAIKISNKDVTKVLNELKIHKASGPDGIPSIVLKNCASALAPVLGKLYRLCLSTCSFPSCWKFAIIQPVPKKGDHSNPSNYRPIALTSVISKIFESLINKKIVKHLDTFNLISDRQYGFRHGRSTGDLLSYLTHSWLSSLRDFGESYTVALDISKAFDRVWHKSLISKLHSFGFSPSLIKLISNFLANRQIAVAVDGSLSDYFPVVAGVPQGSVLSPTLFLIFINDLLSCTYNPIHSFADDTTLHASISFSNNPTLASLDDSRYNLLDSINTDLSLISSWGADNLVKFNASKTHLLPISLKRSLSSYPVLFENSVISPSPSVNILGLTISSDLSWKDHIISLAKVASQKIGVLFRFRNYFTADQLLTVYLSFIRPGIEYCSHIWGFSSSCHLLDRIQDKAIRLINKPDLTNKIPPLSVRRNVASLCLLYRYFFHSCSDELAGCVFDLKQFRRETRLAGLSHPYYLDLHNPRISRYAHSFFYSTAVLWNSLPLAIFPENYNLQLFKQRAYRHLLLTCP